MFRKAFLLFFSLYLLLFSPLYLTQVDAGVDDPDRSYGSQDSITNSVGEYNQAIGLKEEIAGQNPDVTVISQLISLILPYLLTGAGLILFGMLIWGGFTMLTAVTDPKKAEAGKARITAAIIGFLIIFSAYWITQILEIVLGVRILN